MESPEAINNGGERGEEKGREGAIDKGNQGERERLQRVLKRTDGERKRDGKER